MRWQGQVQPRYSEMYTFTTTSDDGVRLSVNGQKVIDNWTDHAPTSNSGTISLIAGQKYDLTMEFYENGGGATAKLAWSSARQPQQIVPQSQLYPNATTPPTLKPALFVVGATTLNNGDSAVLQRLTRLNFAVTVKLARTVTAADAQGKALVVISSTVLSTDVNTMFRSVAVPVFTWEQNLMDDLGMTTDSDHGTIVGQTQVAITNSTSPLIAAANLSGTRRTTTNASIFSWARPNANATVAATLAGDSTKAVIFGYDTNVAMPGLTAPARRVGFFFEDATAATLTSDGWTLFDAAIGWAQGRLD